MVRPKGQRMSRVCYLQFHKHNWANRYVPFLVVLRGHVSCLSAWVRRSSENLGRGVWAGEKEQGPQPGSATSRDPIDGDRGAAQSTSLDTRETISKTAGQALDEARGQSSARRLQEGRGLDLSPFSRRVERCSLDQDNPGK